jgi:uncharacterized protein YdbL (DUF1318 family)
MRVAALALLLLTGCVSVTINVQFPQEKLDSAASSIEDLVSGPASPPANPGPGESTPAEAPAPKAPSDSRREGEPSGGRATWLRWLSPTEAHAQPVPELKVVTPEVKAAIESRRRRNAAVDAAEQAGCLGENTQGLVEARAGTGCPANLGALIAAENADRMFIYKTLVEQNKMPPGDIARVQAAFARARRDKAPAGAWIQQENGQWTRK